MSVITRSGSWSLVIARPCAPSPASMTTCPRSPSTVASSRRFPGRSSTTRIVAISGPSLLGNPVDRQTRLIDGGKTGVIEHRPQSATPDPLGTLRATDPEIHVRGPGAHGLLPGQATGGSAPNPRGVVEGRLHVVPPRQ